MIGAMNLINWIGLLLASGIYFVMTALLDLWGEPMHWVFLATGLLMAPVALFYRPDDLPLD